MCINDIRSVICPSCHDILLAKASPRACRIAFIMGLDHGECGAAWQEIIHEPFLHERACELCQYMADVGIPARSSDIRRQKKRAADMLQRARRQPLNIRASRQAWRPANCAGSVPATGGNGKWRQEHVDDDALTAVRSDEGVAGDQEDYLDEDTELSEGYSLSNQSIPINEEDFMNHNSQGLEDGGDIISYSDTETLVATPDGEDRPALKDISNIVLNEQDSDDEFVEY